jgi:serine/threonine-protein kinase RsbT
VIDAAALLPVVERVVRARMGAHPDADDVVQEAMARIIASADRIDPVTAEAYAITTARNLVTNTWRTQNRFRRNRHRLVDLDRPDGPEESADTDADREAVAAALARLTDAERDLLLAHEVDGVHLEDLARARSTTPGAIGARLHRLRARMRVEYAIASTGTEPPTDRCRPVLLSLASHDRRRRAENDSDHHLLACDYCAGVAPALEDGDEDTVRVHIESDPDIVTARRAVRELAGELGFPKVEQTLVATAVSEMARNVVRFAGAGEVLLSVVGDGRRQGVQVVVRDAGPGIADVEAALRDGYSTYAGLGLGLPGSRRVMDEFELRSEPGRGTTVVMTKWKPGG